MHNSNRSSDDSWWKHRTVMLLINLLIAGAHILPIESSLEGSLLILYKSYFSDYAIPFGAYFLLFGPGRQFSILQHWGVKFAAAFLVPAAAETCQYFGLDVLGSTFDPVDYAMYAAGAFTALVVDRQIFARLLPFWKLERQLPLPKDEQPKAP